MYIFFTDCNVSIRVDNQNSVMRQIRARTLRDIDRFLSRSGFHDSFVQLVQHTPSLDYPWRVTISFSDLEDILAAEAERMDYTSYKDRIAESEPAGIISKRYRLTMAVHDAAAQVQGEAREGDAYTEGG